MIEQQKLRVAVGAINDFDQLQDVVDHLTRSHADLCDLVVLTPPGSLCERLLDVAQLDDDHSGDTLSVAVVREHGDGTLPRQVFARQGGNTALTELATRFEDWIEVHLARRLNRELADGACLLFVRIAAPESEVAISSVLLSHSIDSIQLHDVKIPQQRTPR